MSRFLLRDLASRRTEVNPIEVRYDADRQVSFVRDGDDWVPSWDAAVLMNTKKCDYETGEDQKGQ